MNIKKISVLFLSLTIAQQVVPFSFPFFSRTKLVPPCLEANKGDFTPQNTVFLVDFHNVLAYTDWRQGASVFMSNPDKWTRFSRLITYYWHKLRKSEMIHNFSLHEYLNAGSDSAAFHATNIDWVSSFWVDPKATQLMQDLHNDGYKLILFSNTPKDTILAMQQKNPDLFNLFSGMWYRSKEHNVTKRMPQAYDEVKALGKKALGKTPEHYVFLDDTKGNIKRGNNNGVCGILFKSPLQTRKVLEKVGILNSEQ